MGMVSSDSSIYESHELLWLVLSSYLTDSKVVSVVKSVGILEFFWGSKFHHTVTLRATVTIYFISHLLLTYFGFIKFYNWEKIYWLTTILLITDYGKVLCIFLWFWTWYQINAHWIGFVNSHHENSGASPLIGNMSPGDQYDSRKMEKKANQHSHGTVCLDFIPFIHIKESTKVYKRSVEQKIPLDEQAKHWTREEIG